MARRYDSRTTIFSPEGRLYQVEYAMEAISHSGTAVGLLAGENAAVLAAEKRITSKLLDATRSSERLYQVDDHVGVAVAGITADANILINALRLSAQRYTFRYQEPMPIEQLVQDICDHKQGYTQFGGLRPFGVSFLFAGWDKHFGMQLYNSNPSGNYSGWKATAIGANHQSAQSILKSDFKDDMSVDDAVKLALKVLNKTMDSTALTPEKVELVTMKVKDGKLSYHVYKKEELEPLLNASNENAAQDARE